MGGQCSTTEPHPSPENNLKSNHINPVLQYFLKDNSLDKPFGRCRSKPQKNGRNQRIQRHQMSEAKQPFQRATRFCRAQSTQLTSPHTCRTLANRRLQNIYLDSHV
ncbi:hypothetical protein H671_1g0537 [Cricetulus griseus]|nr:hypothetical protein H671_1g0537 [Cricetulus griseus]